MDNPLNNISRETNESSVVDLKQDLIKALTQSDENFKALVELLPASLMVHRGGKIIYVNPSWVRLLGYDRAEELVGESPLAFVHPDCRKGIEERIARVSGGASDGISEQVLIRRNGESVPVEAEGVAVIYAGVPAVMVIARDISIRKKAQEELFRSEVNLKAMIERMPDGIIVIKNGAVVFVNPAAAKLFGYEDRSVMVGASIMSLLSPEYRSVVTGRIKWLSQGGAKNVPMEEIMLHKNGTGIDVEVSSISVVFEGEQAVMAVIRDIRERKRSEEDLKESHLLLEKAQHAGHVGYWTAELKEGGKVFWSKETLSMFGVTAEVFGGRVEDFFAMVHPEDLGMIKKAIAASIQENAPYKPEFRIIRPDGTIRWICGEAEVVRDQSGVPLKLIGMTMDITERREAEAALQKRDRQAFLSDKLATVGTMAAGVAHEIKNPLTFLLANLKFLEENIEELRSRNGQASFAEPRVSGIFKEIQAELNDSLVGAERIRDIVKGLKSFARADDETISTLDLNETLDGALNMVFHEIKLKARLEKDLGIDLPKIKANPGKLQQVFINLLMNAAQAIETRGADSNKIRVRTGLEGDEVFVEISDTGKGIPEKDFHRIFDPFFTTKPVGVGTGLGLSICQQIVKAFRGTIGVQSQVGKGSVFTVFLPIHSISDNGPLLLDKAPENLELTGLRILIVDDEPANLEIFSRMLKKQHQVLSALTGLDALEILEREAGKVGVIVSDLNMPDMGGIEFHGAVASKYPGLEKRMVFVTGGSFSPEATQFLEGTGNPFLEKPFKISELQEAILKVAGPLQP